MSDTPAISKPDTISIVVRTLIAAVGATAINNLYSLAYTAITGVSIPEVINPVSVSIFSVAPVIVGGLIYWIASRFSVRVANIGLLIGTIVVTILMTIPSFGETIQTPGGTYPAPDGFAGLSVGLHVAGPLLLLLLVPKWKDR